MVLFKNSHSKPVENTLFSVEKLADVNFFIVIDNRRIAAHKMVLANASKVFQRMFYGDLKEEGDEIEIVDSSAIAFIEFLRCVYASQLDLTVDIIADVMNLARKYDIAECFAYCEQFLNEHLPVERAFLGFQLAVLFESTELKNKFGHMIAEQPNAVFESDEFIECSRNVLKNLLEMVSFLCDPEDVFDACMEWADHKKISENQREALGDCLYLIPFQQMFKYQISRIIQNNSGLFNQKELEDLIILVTSEEATAVTKSMFGPKVTMETENTVIVCSNYCNVAENQKHWIKKQEKFRFKEVESSIITAFRLLEIRRNRLTDNESDNFGKQDLSGMLTIVERNERKILLKQYVSVHVFCYSGISRHLVKLIKPIAVEKGKKYEIQFNFDSSWAEQTFYAVIPNSYEFARGGIIESVFFCSSD